MVLCHIQDLRGGSGSDGVLSLCWCAFSIFYCPSRLDCLHTVSHHVRKYHLTIRYMYWEREHYIGRTPELLGMLMKAGRKTREIRQVVNCPTMIDGAQHLSGGHDRLISQAHVAPPSYKNHSGRHFVIVAFIWLTYWQRPYWEDKGDLPGVDHLAILLVR